MPGIYGLDPCLSDPSRKLPDLGLWPVIDVKTSNQRENSLSRKGGCNLIDNIIRSSMRTAIKNYETGGCLKNETLLVRKIIWFPYPVVPQVHHILLAYFSKPFSFMRDQ